MDGTDHEYWERACNEEHAQWSKTPEGQKTLGYWNNLEADNKALRAQLTTLQAQSVEQALLVERLMSLRAKHFDAECWTCREGDPCKHKEALELSNQPIPATIGVKALEVVRAALEFCKCRKEYLETGKTPVFVRGEMGLTEAAASFTPEELKQLGVG